jgi:hypothetical protein
MLYDGAGPDSRLGYVIKWSCLEYERHDFTPT